MSLHCAIDGKSHHVIEQIIPDGADNVRWPDHIPLRPRFLAVCGERILLWVVEIVLQRHARIGLERRVGSWAYMETIVLGSGLQKEALRLEARFLQAVGEVDD